MTVLLLLPLMQKVCNGCDIYGYPKMPLALWPCAYAEINLADRFAYQCDKV